MNYNIYLVGSKYTYYGECYSAGNHLIILEIEKDI